MELVAGQPFLLIKNGLPFEYPKLEQDIHAEAVIIGGGISGALTAYHLVEAGIECVLVDGRTIGLGSTCASTSLLQYELDIPLHKLCNIIGEVKAVKAYQLCGEAIDKLITVMERIGFTGYDRRKSLYFSVHKDEEEFMKSELIARRDAGFKVQLLDESELKTQFGLHAASAILSESGATNDAYAFTHALLQYSIKKGLKVFDRTTISEIQYNSDDVKLSTADGRKITAAHLINASGYEVVDFIEKGIVDLDCTYATISETVDPSEFWKDKVMMWNTGNPYSYLCVVDERRVVIGGRDEKFVNKKTMHGLLDRKSGELEKDIREFLPSFPFRKEFSWSGVFGKTKDSLPYIGHYKKHPRTFYALGFGGNGITFSIIAAEIIRDLICRKQNSNAALFSFDR